MKPEQLTLPILMSTFIARKIKYIKCCIVIYMVTFSVTLMEWDCKHRCTPVTYKDC